MLSLDPGGGLSSGHSHILSPDPGHKLNADHVHNSGQRLSHNPGYTLSPDPGHTLNPGPIHIPSPDPGCTLSPDQSSYDLYPVLDHTLSVTLATHCYLTLPHLGLTLLTHLPSSWSHAKP